MIDCPPLPSNDDTIENVSSFDIKETITKSRPKNNGMTASHETDRIIKGTESKKKHKNYLSSNPVSSAKDTHSPKLGGKNTLHNDREHGEIGHFDTGQIEALPGDDGIIDFHFLPELFDSNVIISFCGNMGFQESLEGVEWPEIGQISRSLLVMIFITQLRCVQVWCPVFSALLRIHQYTSPLQLRRWPWVVSGLYALKMSLKVTRIIININ